MHHSRGVNRHKFHRGALLWVSRDIPIKNRSVHPECKPRQSETAIYLGKLPIKKRSETAYWVRKSSSSKSPTTSSSYLNGGKLRVKASQSVEFFILAAAARRAEAIRGSPSSFRPSVIVSDRQRHLPEGENPASTSSTPQSSEKLQPERTAAVHFATFFYTLFAAVSWKKQRVWHLVTRSEFGT